MSFWTGVFNGRNLTVRCVTYFDADFHQTGDVCSQAVTPSQ